MKRSRFKFRPSAIPSTSLILPLRSSDALLFKQKFLIAVPLEDASSRTDSLSQFKQKEKQDGRNNGHCDPQLLNAVIAC